MLIMVDDDRMQLCLESELSLEPSDSEPLDAIH